MGQWSCTATVYLLSLWTLPMTFTLSLSLSLSLSHHPWSLLDLFFMLLDLTHIWLILIRADQPANLECDLQMRSSVIVSNWCIALESKVVQNPLCSLTVSRVRSYWPNATEAHRPFPVDQGFSTWALLTFGLG